MAEETVAEVAPVTYEELVSIEEEFEDIDVEIIRQQYELSKEAYARRTAAVAKIPTFWPLVLEQAPPEIDSLITPEDSRILAELSNITVTRPEIEGGKKGHPRSVSIRFEFNPNDAFEDKFLEKHFHYRRANDGWVGLVSEPVKIHWKEGRDLTEGLTDGAYNLFEARKKKGEMQTKDVKEYDAMKDKVENWSTQNTSFFSWFGFISEKRWISAEENEQANKEHQVKKASRGKGEEVAMPEISEAEIEAEEDHEAIEVCENGEDVIVSFTEDLWPNAIKFFTGAQEIGDISDAEFEDFDDEDMEEVDGDDEPVDIRALVQDKGDKSRTKSEDGPPSKKAKK